MKVRGITAVMIDHPMADIMTATHMAVPTATTAIVALRAMEGLTMTGTISDREAPISRARARMAAPGTGRVAIGDRTGQAMMANGHPEALTGTANPGRSTTMATG